MMTQQTLNLPLELMQQVQEHRSRLLVYNAAKIEELAQKVRVKPDLIPRHAEALKLNSKLTSQGLLRLLVELGLSELRDMPLEKIAAALAQSSVIRGRPRVGGR